MIVVKSIDDVKAFVYGGAFYGGGGGGWISEGLEVAKTVLNIAGEVKILEPHEIPDEYILVTVSAVGAPAAKERYLKPIHLVRAIQLLISNNVKIHGLIPSEVGAYNGVNGWFQSAILGIPVIDIPCNGRAHPTGIMGSMGLHRKKDYISRQAAVGGNPEKGMYVEIYVSASLEKAAHIIRKAAEEAGGVVAVARNPVDAKYAKEYGAPNALKKAFSVGKVIKKYIDENAFKETCYKAFEEAKGSIIGECLIEKTEIETSKGFDVGSIEISCSGRKYLIKFLNEYIVLDKNSTRLATFPDLIVLMNPETGLPITSAEIVEYKGKKVILGFVPRENLILGAGVRYPEAYDPLEKVLGVKIKDYIKDLFLG